MDSSSACSSIFIEYVFGHTSTQTRRHYRNAMDQLIPLFTWAPKMLFTSHGRDLWQSSEKIKGRVQYATEIKSYFVRFISWRVDVTKRPAHVFRRAPS